MFSRLLNLLYSRRPLTITWDAAAPERKKETASEADLDALGRAADAAWKGDFSPKLEVRIHAERVGTRGFWETIEVRRAQFGRDDVLNIVFKADVVHELYESIDSSMPRQRQARASHDVAAIIKSDGTVLSAHLGERRMERISFSEDITWDRASPSIDWGKVAVASARRLRG